jgi:hypothetical protein
MGVEQVLTGLRIGLTQERFKDPLLNINIPSNGKMNENSTACRLGTTQRRQLFASTRPKLKQGQDLIVTEAWVSQG